jgi:hypothetical protein
MELLALQDHKFAVPVQGHDWSGNGPGQTRKTLYTTRAAAGAPASGRLAGGLYAIQTTRSGLPEIRFCGFDS